MDISIIIPCYNEADNVSKIESEFLPVARELAETKSVEVVFVDDGSQDDTWQTLHATFGSGEPGPVVFKFERHPVNRGLGAALRTGFAAAQGQIIVTTDSDGTYRFSTIPALLACLAQQPDLDVVTASPYHPQGGVDGVPAYRLILSRGSSLIYRLLVDWRVHTYTALYRAYRRQVIDHVTCTSDGYLAGTELLVMAMLAGYRVAEYPAVLYRRVYGVSKAKLTRTILAHLGFQGSVLLHRLRLMQFGHPLETAKEGQQWV
jgi:dolichol-phosphate mannosyltransferase